MKAVCKKLSDTKIELTVSLDKDDLNKAEAVALEQLSKEIKVEGFRKGKVPAEIAKKFIPENELNAKTIDIAIRNTIMDAFEQTKQSPLAMPEISVKKYVPNDMSEYTATADVLPEIKLGNYKNLKVKKPASKVAQKDIDEVLKNISEAYAEKKVVKRKAAEKDEVIIDFVGKKDGVAFNGGSAKDYHLTLGSHSFIPGFEEGIVGHESGDKFNLNLTFPKDYGVKDLAGAKTVFEVLLKQVNEVAPAELNDELAQKCQLESLDALKKDIEKNLKLQDEHRINEKYKDDLIRAIIESSKITAPEILIKDQLNMIKEDIANNAASQGLSFDDYLSQVGQTEADWEKEAKKVAEDRVKSSLTLQVIARDEKITVEDELVEAKIAELKDVYKKSEEALKSLKDPRVKADIKNRMIIEKTIDFLVKENEK